MSRFYEYQKRIVSVFLICLMCMSVYACGKKQDAMDQGSGLHGDRGR